MTRNNLRRLQESARRVADALRAHAPESMTKAEIQRASGMSHRAVTSGLGRLADWLEREPVTRTRPGPTCYDGTRATQSYRTTAYRFRP